MKRTLPNLILRTLFPRSILSRLSLGRALGPAEGLSRTEPKKLVMGDLNRGCYENISIKRDHSYRANILEFSNHLYIKTLVLQERKAYNL